MLYYVYNRKIAVCFYIYLNIKRISHARNEFYTNTDVYKNVYTTDLNRLTVGYELKQKPKCINGLLPYVCTYTVCVCYERSGHIHSQQSGNPCCVMERALLLLLLLLLLFLLADKREPDLSDIQCYYEIERLSRCFKGFRQ